MHPVTGSSQAGPPGVATGPRRRDSGSDQPGSAPRGELESPVVGTPQAHPSSDERAQTLEHVIEPPYWRRSIMQMEFPCSLNCTASTSLRMR